MLRMLPWHPIVHCYLIFFMVVKYDFHFKQMDVKTTCVNSPLVHGVCMQIPKGHIRPLGHSFGKLVKSLYELS